jgi:hypothetical protein
VRIAGSEGFTRFRRSETLTKNRANSIKSFNKCALQELQIVRASLGIRGIKILTKSCLNSKKGSFKGHREDCR